MIVPIDLLKPILDDLSKFGRVNQPVRPWLGLYATEIEDKIVVGRRRAEGPAARAELKTGDVMVAVGGAEVATLAELYRADLGARARRRRGAADARIATASPSTCG